MKKGSRVAAKSRVEVRDEMSLEQMLVTPPRDLQTTVLRQRVRNTLQQVVADEMHIMMENLCRETTATG